MPQYFKLARKIRAGAQWVIPQLGYDMRKFHEVKLFLEWANLQRPVIGNVYLLNKTVAGMFNANKIPGCVVSDQLKELCEKQAAGPDKGEKFFQELAAKQLAVLQGDGIRGRLSGGIAKAETFGKIIDLAESFGENDWKEFVEGDSVRPGRGVLPVRAGPGDEAGASGQVNKAYLESLKQPAKTKNVTVGYRLARKVHDARVHAGYGDVQRGQGGLREAGEEQGWGAVAGDALAGVCGRRRGRTAARIAATARCPIVRICARGRAARSAAATARAAAASMAGANWTTRNASGRGPTTG